MLINKYGKNRPSEKYKGEFISSGDEILCTCGGDFKHVSASIIDNTVTHVYKCKECGNIIESRQI